MNYFRIENILMERLKGGLPQIHNIITHSYSGEIPETINVFPTIYIQYVKETINNPNNTTSFYNVDQVWAIIILTQNSSLIDSKLFEPGEIITDVINLVQGWNPDQSYIGSPFKRIDSQPPIYKDGGYLLFPIYFSIKILIGEHD
jgi:hypothetical protein